MPRARLAAKLSKKRLGRGEDGEHPRPLERAGATVNAPANALKR
jgi:hypothetical protein